MNRKDKCVVNDIYLIINNYVKKGGHLKYNGRNIGVLIYEHSCTYTGLTSEAALIEKFNDGNDWCKEHIWPRQLAGEALLKHFTQVKRVTRPAVAKAILPYTIVNRVTKNENALLKPFQKRRTFVSPETAYKEAGVSRLLRWPSSKRIADLPKVFPALQQSLTRKKPAKR